jgi:protein-S-isoprenylcysteine O-methyltransferase Ste14
MIRFDTVILLSWAVFLVVWAIGAFRVKRDVAMRGGMLGLVLSQFLMRLGIGVLVVLVAKRISPRTMPGGGSVFRHGAVFTPPLLLGWIGAALTVGGIAFAIWARLHLGRNWSSRPAKKVDHELVTSGPYRQVRHPIYTGMIIAVFGSALTGSLFALVIFFIVSITFGLRVSKEERFMLELFPDTYPAYRRRTKRLIPFVW